MTSASLQSILQDPRIWLGAALAQPVQQGISTGFPALDQQLPSHGWPYGGITELLYERSGMGELRLLLPSLASHTQQQRWVVLIGPPYIPFPAGWQAAGVDLRYLLWLRTTTQTDQLWAMEQVLRSPNCGSALLWPEYTPVDKAWRRLQLAAEEGGGHGVILEETAQDQRSSPVGLRLRVTHTPLGIQVNILKRRGSPATSPVLLEATPCNTPLFGRGHMSWLS
ncbi:translesion DNA synthesis-associated protein ImuA [Chitinivorax sp. B]|uniref:translesion DNA synthesis-associated protein ImuA n=1 Tax=Chitinivorax sp. B TaxID=2502235 RepID=UPI001485A02D|nr:translesion DNA synthesis-associated protein ImuA [Chitinivorax sp. B]